MLTSERRNNMALPPGSQSRDLFDFFDDKVDATVDTGEHVSSGEPEDKPVRQIVRDTENIGTSGKQLTEISFRGIEEVIELESNVTDTPEISKLDGSNHVPGEVSLPSGSTGPSKVNQNSENTSQNQKFQSPVERNVAPADDDSLSVFSLLSNISLTENKSDQKRENKLDSNIASQSEAKPATNKQDELDLFENIVDTDDDSSQEPSLDIGRELSFSWLKSEPAKRKSSPPIKGEKSASPFKSHDSDEDGDRDKTKAESASVASDTRFHRERREVSVRKSSIPILDNKSKDNMESEVHAAGTDESSNGGRAYSMQDLSWLTDDKDSQRKLSEPQKDREFSWLKTDTTVNRSESESKLGEQNLRETEPQKTSNVSWLQSNKDVKDSRVSEIANISSHSYEAADEFDLGLNKPSDMDTGANEGVDVTSHHSKEVDKLNLDPDKTIMDINSYLKEGPEKVDSNSNDTANDLKFHQSKTMNELEADLNKATKEVKSEPREGMRELDIGSSEPTAELDTRPNKTEKNVESDSNAADKDVKAPNEGINELDSDLNKSMEDLDFGWLKSKQETVKAESISDFSLKSSQRATPELPMTQVTTVAKHTVGWSEEKEDITLARSPSDKQGNGRCSSSDTLTPNGNNATSHRGNYASMGSVRNVPNENDTARDKSGRKEPDFPVQMNDLNFDFMAKEKAENKNNDPVVTGDATASSLTASPALSYHKADLPSVDNNKTEFDTKQFQSNGSLTPSQNIGAGSSEVGDAIHSAVALFHDEKDASSNVVNSKSTKKQKKKTKRQNGSQQHADKQKKTAKTYKKDMATNDGSEQKNTTKPKVQNTKRQDTGKGKNSSEVNSGSKEKGKQKASKQKTDSESRRSKNDNGNSSKAVGNDYSGESLESSDRLQSTTESADTIIKIDDVSSHSLAYEDDFEDDARSVKSMVSSKSYLTSDSQRKGPPALAYSSTPYGSVYTAYERQTKHPIGNQNVRFPKINTLKPVQLTSGQSSFSEQSFSTVAKKKRKAKKNPPYSQDSYEFKAASDPDSKPEIILRKAGKVPVSLKAEAVYQKGRLEIAVVDERKRLSEDPNMDVRITVLHKHLDSFPFVKKRPKKLPKLNFATNRDILNHRAAYPPFNTYVDEQASERFKQTFGS